MTGGRIASSVARAFIVIGALLLAFVAFQLWGTSFYEHHAQDRLRQQFLASLHPSDPARPVCQGPAATGTAGGITVSVSRAGCLSTGTKITVSASGLPSSSVGAVTECNNSPNQPLVSLAGIALVPVGCTDPLFTVRPVDAHGQLAPVPFALRTGMVGPPAGGVDSTGAQASTDAAKYPCPPTPAQAAAGVSCVMRAGVLDVASKTYVTAPVALAFGTSSGASSTPTTAPATTAPTTTTTAAGTTAGGSSDSGVIGSAANVAPAGAPGIGQAVGLMSIPRIGMTNDAIVQGVGESQLQQGPGHYPGTPLPGQEGNAAIAGHRTTYAAPFYNLNQLQPGDPITIQTQGGLFHYQVTQSLVVPPTDVAVLNTSALPTLTLTTCNPRYSATTRLVVVALLVGAQRVATVSTPAATPTTTASGTGVHGAAPSSPAASHRASGASSSNAGPTGSVGGAFFWGVVTLLAAVAVRLLWRRLRRPVRWGALVLGVPGVLVVLFVFFEHVSVALPASF